MKKYLALLALFVGCNLFANEDVALLNNEELTTEEQAQVKEEETIVFEDSSDAEEVLEESAQ